MVLIGVKGVLILRDYIDTIAHIWKSIHNKFVRLDDTSEVDYICGKSVFHLIGSH